ncbi:MAG: tetratricopeptide repeat protein [Deltaproteobacteria bacterium]|nr:tetratricopeptide repeat protein [Deltaproteobacteria bacterium]
MSVESVRKLLGILLDDPENESSWGQLEELAVGGDLAAVGPEIPAALEEFRNTLIARAEAEGAARMLDIEAMVATNDARKHALIRERARLLEQELLDDRAALAALTSIKDQDPEAAEAAESVALKKDKWKELVSAFKKHAEQATDTSLMASNLASAAVVVRQYKGKGKDKESETLFNEALSVDPSNLRVALLYERVLRSRGDQWDALARHQETCAAAVTELDQRIYLYLRAARTHAARRRDYASAERCYRQVLALVPSQRDANRFLVGLLSEQDRQEDLASLYESQLQLDDHRNDIGLLVQVGMIHWRVRNDPRSALPFFRKLSQESPGHPLAKSFFDENPASELLAEVRDGNESEEDQVTLTTSDDDDELVTEIVIDNPSPASLPPPASESSSSAVVIPKDIAPSIAIVAAPEPEVPATVVSVATPDPAPARPSTAPARSGNPSQKLMMAIDIAKQFEENGQHDKAIDGWKAVLRIDSADPSAREALIRLYGVAGRWNNVIELLRQEVDSLGGSKAIGDPSTVSRRVEILREMASVYQDKLSLEPMVVQTYNAILTLTPSDRVTLIALAESYEKLGRHTDLIKVLDQQAEHFEEPSEKIELLRRIASIWVERFNNVNNATKPLETILSIDPSDSQAIQELKDLYNKRRAWRPLYEVLRKEAATLNGTARRDALIEVAKLATERLSSPAEAISSWREALAHDSKAEGALDALEKLTEREKDWASLAEVLEQRATEAEDDDARVAVLMKLGTVYSERMNDSAKSIDAWRRVLDVKPGQSKALRVLRDAYTSASDWDALERLYSESNDFEGLVDVFGNAADRADDSATKIALSFRAASVYETQLGQTQRAFRSYERVLTVEPNNRRAAQALVPIYLADDKYARLAQMYEILLATSDAADESGRLELLEKLREANATRLHDPKAAFNWALQAFKIRPTDLQLEEQLDAAAQAATSWAPVVEALDAHAATLTDEAEKARLRDRSAAIEADQLAAPDRAIKRYRSALESSPDDQVVLRALDGLFRRPGHWEDLRSLYDHRLARSTSTEERRTLLLEAAELEETILETPDQAAVRYRSILQETPLDSRALESLSRLAQSAGRWDELSQLLSTRRDASEGVDRAELAYKLGQLRLERTSNFEAAIEAFREALTLAPHHEATLAALETLLRNDDHRVTVARLLEPEFSATDQPRKLAWVLQILLDSATDSNERRGLALRLAEVFGQRLDDSLAGFELLCAIYAQQPQDAELADATDRLAQRAQSDEKLVATLATLFDRTDLAPETRVDVARRAAAVLDARLGRPDDAERYHQAVLADGSLDTLALEQLRALYQMRERYTDLRSLYAMWTAREESVDVKVDLLGQDAQVAELILNQPTEAITQYQKILELRPDQSNAFEALERLLSSSQQWADLNTLYGNWIDIDPAQSAMLRLRRAGVRSHNLAAFAGAIDDLEVVLEQEPADAGARAELELLVQNEKSVRGRAGAILERLYESDGIDSSANMVRMLRIRLEQTQDSFERSRLLRRIAEILEVNLGDLLAAFEAMTEALLAEPSRDSLRHELSRLAELADRNSDGAAAMLLAADDSSVGDALVPLLCDVADIYDNRLHDLANAERVYQRLLALSPDESLQRSSAEALERIYAAQANAPGLVGALLLRAKLELDGQLKGELLSRAAELQETHLRDYPAAILSNQQRIELDPSDKSAFDALIRLYEQSAQWSKQVEALRALADLSDSEDQQKALRLRAASVLVSRLDAKADAVSLYVDVLASYGPDRAVHAQLATLYESSEKWQDLLEILESDRLLADSDADRLDLIVRSSDLRRHRTNEPLSAIDGYREALEIDRGEPRTRKALEELLSDENSTVALGAAQALVSVYESEGQWQDLVRVLQVIVSNSQDEIDRREALERAAQVCDLELRDPEKAFNFTAQDVALSIGLPEIASKLSSLERLAREANIAERHTRTLESIAADLIDPEVQLSTLVRIAELSRDSLKDMANAIRYFERALEARPDYLPALDALERIHEGSGNHEGLLDVLRRKSELAVDDGSRRELLRKQAEVSATSVDDREGAIRAYESLLEIGFDRSAAVALEKLYQQESRWADLCALLESQLAEASSDRVELNYRLGLVTMDHLNEPERSIDYFASALEMQSQHETTVEALERLGTREEFGPRVAEMLEPVYLARQAWPKLVASFETRIQSAQDPIERRTLLERLGTLYEESIEDLDTALVTYGRMYREDIRDRDSWDIVSRMARLLGRHDRLAEIFASGLSQESEDDEITSELSITTAKLFLQHSADKQDAKKYFRRALSFNPQNVEVFLALEAVLLSQSANDELCELYRDNAEKAAEPQRQRELLFKLADIQEKSLDQPAEAIGTFRQLLDLDSNDRDAILRLDALLTRTTAWRDLAVLLERRIDNAVDSTARSTLRVRLASILSDQLDDSLGAVDTLEQVLLERPDQEPAIIALERLAEHNEPLRQRITEILEPIYRSLDSWPKLVEVLTARLADCTDTLQRGEILSEIGSLKETRANDVHGAFAAYSAAFTADPGDSNARDSVQRLATAHSLWDDLVRTYEAAIGATTDSLLQTELLRSIAETHDLRRDAPRDAIIAWERLFALDDTQIDVLDELQNLHVLLSDWGGLVSVLERKVERTMDDLERRSMLHEIGEYQCHMIGDKVAAISAYRRALDTDPSDPVSLEALDDLYSETKASRELSEILSQRLDIEVDGDERRKLALRLGRLFETALSDNQQAVDAYRRALDESTGDTEALRSLERLYRATDAHQDLLENLQTQVSVAENEPARNELRVQIGALQAGSLGDSAGALESYRDVLLSEPTRNEAIDAMQVLARDEGLRFEATQVLEPILRDSQRWKELAAVLELKITTLSDPLLRRDELLQLAALLEERCADDVGAFDAWRRVLHEDQTQPDVVNALNRLGEKLNRWSDVATIFEEESVRASDSVVSRDLAVRAAHIAADRLNDGTRAISSYRQALGQGDEDSILASLEAIYEKDQQWGDVVEMIERRVAIANSPSQLDTLELKLADIHVARFGQSLQALASYRSVADRSPSNVEALQGMRGLLEKPEARMEALEALEAAYGALNDVQQLDALKQLRINDTQNPAEKHRLWVELSQLREDRLNDPGAALAAMVQAYRTDPQDESSLGELERLAQASGQWESLRGVVESALAEASDVPSITRSASLLRAATWYSERLGDSASSESRLREALEADPENTEVLALLEKLLRTPGRELELASTLKRRAELEFDTVMKKQRFREAAKLSEAHGALDQAADLMNRCLDADDADVETLEEFARLRALQGRHEDEADLLTRRAGIESDPQVAKTLRRRVAELFSGPINNQDRAVAAYRELLDFDPTDTEARSAIEALFEKNARYRELEEALRGRVDHAIDSGERNATRLRLASLAENRFGEPERAIDYLREILEETPSDNKAADELERLFGQLRRWADLAELLERRAQDCADSSDTVGELSALVRIGSLHERELNDAPKAIDIYERVLERDSEHSGALAALARLAEADSQWQRAAEMLQRALSSAKPGREGAETAHRLGVLQLDRLSEESPAEASWRKAVALDPSFLPAIERLRDLANRRNDAAMQAEVGELELAITTAVPSQIALHQRLAELYRDRLANAGRAAEHLERASALAPENRDLLLPLVDVYLAAGRQRDAIPVIEQIITSYGTRRSKELATWHHRLGLAMQALGDDSGALAQLDSAFKIDLTNVNILKDLGLLCYKLGDFDRAQKTFRALLLQRLDANSGITKADVYFYLGDTLHRQGDDAKAIGMLERALDAEKTHPAASELLAKLKG